MSLFYQLLFGDPGTSLMSLPGACAAAPCTVIMAAAKVRNKSLLSMCLLSFYCLLSFLMLPFGCFISPLWPFYIALIAFLHSLYGLFNIAYYELADLVHLAESAAYCADGVATFLQLRLPMAGYIVALVVASDI